MYKQIDYPRPISDSLLLLAYTNSTLDHGHRVVFLRHLITALLFINTRRFDFDTISRTMGFSIKQWGLDDYKAFPFYHLPNYTRGER